MMKHLYLLISFMICLSTSAQIVRQNEVNNHRGSNYANNYRNQQHLTIVEVGGTAQVFLPSFIYELDPSSVRFVSNEYIEIIRSNKRDCVIRGRRSVNATQLICRYVWSEPGRDGKKKEHEDVYTFNVAVIRLEPEGVNIPQETIVGWDCNSYLHPELYPKNAECGFSYRSDDTSIATVSTTGVVKGVSLGETDITITTTNGLTTSTHVVVLVPECTSVKFKETDKHFGYVDDEQDLQVEINPYRAQPQLSWSSSDPDVVSVDQYGHIRAIAPGKATIYLTTDNGEKYDKSFKIKQRK